MPTAWRQLQGYLAEPLDTTDLVLVHQGRPTKRLLDVVKAAGGTVAGADVGSNRRDRAGFVAEQVAAAGLRLDQAALGLLTDHLGEDLNRLAGLLEMLEATYGTDHRSGRHGRPGPLPRRRRRGATVGPHRRHRPRRPGGCPRRARPDVTRRRPSPTPDHGHPPHPLHPAAPAGRVGGGGRGRPRRPSSASRASRRRRRSSVHGPWGQRPSTRRCSCSPGPTSTCAVSVSSPRTRCSRCSWPGSAGSPAAGALPPQADADGRRPPGQARSGQVNSGQLRQFKPRWSWPRRPASSCGSCDGPPGSCG